VALAAASAVEGQVPESPGDPYGVALSVPLVHLVHTDDPAPQGGTAHLRAEDPFLLYQLGRELVQRQYTLDLGALGQSGELTVPLYVRRGPASSAPVARFARGHATSCGACHSVPYREPGVGQTIASTSGSGRSTTHFYGGGLVEMLGLQVRAEILDRYDRDRDGLLQRAEIAAPSPVRIVPAPGAAAVDYGDLSPGADGVPRLDTVFRVWFVDAAGAVVPDVFGFGDPRVAALDLAMQPFGWGRGRRGLPDGRSVAEGGEAATLREIAAFAADVHMGLQAFDPGHLRSDGGYGGVAGVSLHGALQFDFGLIPDRGATRDAAGISLDDPDRDGHVSELTAGDLDAIEFYLLHAPQPVLPVGAEADAGKAVLREIGCTRCHVERWLLPARDPERGFAGDRRLFRFEAEVRLSAGGAGEPVGRLIPSVGDRSGEPAGGPVAIEGVYSDFKHWDIGPAFHERRFDGTLQREHRTAPLWGVGSGAPYGHSGGFPSLDGVIAAHAGAAAAEAAAYRELSAAPREVLLAYLRSLVLYVTDEIPADVDGDGERAETFEVAGREVGPERFDARWLFREPPRLERLWETRSPAGRPRVLAVLEDPRRAYRLDLPLRRDSDGDGLPDALEAGEPSAGAER
jgi:hypothetical protein